MVIFDDASGSLVCESAEGFFNDVALRQFTADVIERESLQYGNVILR